MLILALETSSQAGSVALLDRDTVLSERRLPSDRRSATTLAPAMAEVLTEARREPQDVQLVAVTIGPGSFTGLRVGVTTAKTFAYAIGAEVLGLNTLEVIASQAPLNQVAKCGSIHAVLDAQRKELFHAQFLAGRSSVILDGDEQDRHVHGDSHGIAELVRIENSAQILPATAWIASLDAGDVVTGPGLRRLVGELPSRILSVPANFWEPQAVTVGRLAFRHYQRGRRDDLWKLAPQYLRASAAEEKARFP